MSQDVLTSKDVERIAAYARIGLDDQELVQMTEQLNEIIASLGTIFEYDLEGVEPTFHPVAGLTNVMRDDVEVPGFTQDEALSNAAATSDGNFLIPSILGGGDA